MPNRSPRIGMIGIMQELYDDMLPGITERQGGYVAELAAALGGVAECVVAPPARNREDVERAMREFEDAGVDGVLVVMLTYGPGQRVARALAETRLPLCLANIQPERRGHRRVGHGGHDLQPGRPRRAGHRERARPGRRDVRRGDRGLAERRVPRTAWAAGRGPRAAVTAGGR